MSQAGRSLAQLNPSLFQNQNLRQKFLLQKNQHSVIFASIALSLVQYSLKVKIIIQFLSGTLFFLLYHLFSKSGGDYKFCE